jgi:hypothetical protein
MKYLNSRNHEALAAGYDTLREYISELPYNGENFVVLYRDASGDYVQTALENPDDDENSRYLVKARVYHGENFTHYRSFFATAAEVLPAFEAYYHDRPFDYSGWQDVSAEFT